MQEKELENAPVRFGANMGMLLELHEMYQEDPNSVSEEMRFLFENLSSGGAVADSSGTDHKKVKNLLHLIDNIRLFGHLKSEIYPVYDPDIKNVPSLDFKDYDLTEEDLKNMPATVVSEYLSDDNDNAYEALMQLHDLYTGPIAYEYMHVNDTEERQWFKEMIADQRNFEMSDDEKKHLFKMLAKVEGFEKYIHKNFVGAKRFSIEGLDSIVPMLDHLLTLMAGQGIPNLQIGMAHRGRLNVLTHILEKPYEMMISEFMHTDPMKFLPEDGSLEITQGWMRDVKYHLGGAKTRSDKGLEQRITLANNPSHLEVAGPVVLGRTRAQQETANLAGRPEQDTNKAIAAIIHGDAAFPGQGIVYESLNLGKLNGYSVGGSLHIIANNRIGFTTEETDARSTVYASDPALGFDLPVIHVNADKPEHVLRAMEIALRYRQQFGKDIVIDVIGYRRYGHNEMDEPSATNPLLYKEVKSRETLEELYGARLVDEDILSEDEKQEIIQSVFDEMRAAHDAIDKNDTNIDGDLKAPDSVMEGQDSNSEDNISRERLQKINDALLDYPENFTVFKKLSKVLDRRKKPFEDDKELVDWAHAEALAFATINQDGTPIRLTGQDSERGTFAQRHAVLHDPESGEELVPLHNVEDLSASFDIHNSPLSEAAVVGFDYGYNIEHKDVMTIWEAQYGDFSNMAQVLFDNFLSSGNAKWGETSGMTLFLPHGQEGQGAEHSSARLERYLQLAAENNMTVANLSSASNYFHLLRKQAQYMDTEKMRPLVLMTPKSLLRNAIVSEPVSAFTEGQFREVIIPSYKKTKVKKVLIASGKMAVDLLAEQKDNPDDEIIVVRLEQIYPFPSEQLKDLLDDLKNLEEVRFVQEEPKNMGAYHYALPLLLEILPEKVELNYVGRLRRASPAEGDGESYKLIQQKIIETAFK